MDQFKDRVVVLRALVDPPQKAKLSKEKIKDMEATMQRLKYLDDDVLLAYERRFPEFTIEQSEILMTLATMIYGPLNKDLPFAFTLEKLQQTIMTPEHAPIGKGIADLFAARFNPDSPLSDDEYRQRY